MKATAIEIGYMATLGFRDPARRNPLAMPRVLAERPGDWCEGTVSATSKHRTAANIELVGESYGMAARSTSLGRQPG